MTQQSERDTIEIVPPPPAFGGWPRSSSAAVTVDLGALSHPGKVRPNNEDHYLVTRMQRTMEAVLTNLPAGLMPEHYAETAYGMVVADGVGGAARGEVASRMAIAALADLIQATPDWIMRFDNEQLVKEVMRRLDDRFHAIRVALRQQAETDSSLSGMATTLTLTASLGDNLIIAHVGDSRAYLFRRNELYQLTRDHTLAQQLADRGLPLSEQAGRLRHILTNALGTGGADVHTELHHITLWDGDVLLLCTDGLTDMVSEDAIKQVLGELRPAADACRVLIDQALEAGGKDNVTVVMGRYFIPK
jgi:protein phosphatase